MQMNIVSQLIHDFASKASVHGKRQIVLIMEVCAVIRDLQQCGILTSVDSD